MDEALDRYDAQDIDDEGGPELTAEQRRAAEREMALRDRREARRGQGGRAARRSNAPDFLRDDDEMDDDLMDGGLLSDLTKRRTRRQYDERQNVDDAAGGEIVSIGQRDFDLSSPQYQGRSSAHARALSNQSWFDC